MDFMGIGPLEVLTILIIGFLLLGPDKLPEMAAKAGRLYRNFKKATFDLSKTLSEEVSAEKKTLKEDLSAEKKTLSEDLSNISKTITEDLLSENKAENDSVTTSAQESDENLSVENTEKRRPASACDEKVNER